MAIQFNCPSCEASIKVPDAASGKIGRCPKCEQRLRVPALAPPAATTTPPEEKTKPAESPKPAPTPQAPPASSSPPAPPAEVPAPSAREEYAEGRKLLEAKAVAGAAWPLADRAVEHFIRAAELDPENFDYAAQVGVACQASIQRFLQSWGDGPLVSIAAFLIEQPLGQQIDADLQLFRPTRLTDENLQWLRSRANLALKWYGRALGIQPDDAVTLCHRAELLQHVGAFAPALADITRALSSPLAPSRTRESAQRVADFILEEESPLRTYLTRAEAQRFAGPAEIDRPAPLPAKSSPQPATIPAHADADPFSFVVRDSDAPSGPVFPGSHPPAGEFPAFPVGGSELSGGSVAARLKKKRGRSAATWLIPVILGALLLAGGGAYLYINRVKFVGTMAGEDLGTNSVQRTLASSLFNCPAAEMQSLLTTLQTNPETIRTSYRSVQLTGAPGGLRVSVRPSEEWRLVRVDLRADPNLAQFAKEKADVLERSRGAAVMPMLSQFCKDWSNAVGSGMEMGNLNTYLGVLAGDALVSGLGYHTVAQSGQHTLPCVYEDDQGLYYIVPANVSQFAIIERVDARPNPEESVFETEFRYDVTVSPAASASPGTPTPAPAATPSEGDAEAEPMNEAEPTGEAPTPDQ